MSSPLPAFSVALVDDEGPRRLVITGELDVASAPELEVALAEIEVGTTIDALGLTFCDSTGLSRLLVAARRYEAAGERLVLLASTSLRRTLDLASVTSVFDLPDVTD